MNSRPLLITSNGFGMGHLIRQLAISKRFPNAAILTLSGAAPIALQNGAHLEYCPSYSVPWMSKRTWHRGYLRDRIITLAKETRADVLVFDGVVPYVGLVNAIRALGLPAVWMRRGVWRATAKTWPLTYGKVFDLIIEPGDIGDTHDQGATRNRADAVKVGVITEAGRTLDRTQAAMALGVKPEHKTLLFNIGSNRNIDFAAVASVLDAHTDWNVIATSDALQRQRSAHAITQVSGLFPLHPYLSAVDLAVTSVGYNAAHEFVATGVPTIVIPADNATDDQYARADAMVALGTSQRADSGEALASALASWMDQPALMKAAHESALKAAASWAAGADEAAELIASVAAGAHPAPLRLHIRNAIEKLLGLFDRSSRAAWITTETLDAVSMRQPVEHLLAGSSQGYRAERETLARKWLEK